MRVRFPLLPLAVLALGACTQDDGVSVNARPPLGGVRFVNAVPDGGPVDIRMVDQVEWSASSVTTSANYGLPFRAGTIHWPTEAKARHIRVFPTDSSITVTSQILVDTTISVQEGRNVTLVLVGSRAAGNVRFVEVVDNPPTLTGQQIAIRMVNTTAAGQTPSNADAYILATTSTALTPTATWQNIGPLGVSDYVVRDTGTFAVRVAEAGTSTVRASAAVPNGEPASGLISALAGARAGGSAITGFIFPRSVAGTDAPQTTAFASPAIVYFADLAPPPVVATSTP